MSIGTVRATGGTYADGLDHVEISIDKPEALGLPFVEGAGVPIRLRIGKRTVAATLRATRDCLTVWISPKITDERGKRGTLAVLLRDAGIERSQRLSLTADGNLITATATR